MKTYDKNQKPPHGNNPKSEKTGLKKKLTEGSETNRFYDFEELYKNSKRIKVYDFLGKPDYKEINELSEAQISTELKRLLEIINSNRISIDFCCRYDDSTVYKFITDELFNEMIDDIKIPGMRYRFIYEEFHPNHEHTIRYLVKKFFGILLSRKWEDIHGEYMLCPFLKHRAAEICRADFLKHIHRFLETVKPAEPEFISVDLVSCNSESNTGMCGGTVSYLTESEHTKLSGPFTARVILNGANWMISEISFPGFE